MSNSNYRELIVWQKARQLACQVYRVTRDFPRVETFGLSQQMRRAAVSIASNIAEAHGRHSAREILSFLYISRGSTLELETQTVIAGDLEYLRGDSTIQLATQITDVARLLNGLIRHYEKHR